MKKLLIVSFLLFFTLPALSQPTESELRRMFFFATLESLYEMNLSDSTVDTLLTKGKRNGHPVSFIYGCPVCSPVYDAFHLYRQRPSLWGDKRRLRQFGDKATEWDTLLSQKDQKKRTMALGALVKEAVSRKLDSMNLSQTERQQWNRQIAEAHDQGERLLKTYKKDTEFKNAGFTVPTWMEQCEICEGAQGAAGK